MATLLIKKANQILTSGHLREQEKWGSTSMTLASALPKFQKIS